MEKMLKKGELIGKNIEIIGSKNKSNLGLKGKIIDETKNTLEIMTTKGEKKKLIKTNITIELKMEDKKFVIKGSEIHFAPEERIKTR